MSPGAVVVLGSGAAGVACASALVDGGAHVTLVDVGRELEPGRRDVFDTLAAREPEAWPVEADRAARQSLPASVHGGVPYKAVYGSYYPYALDDPECTIASEDAEVVISLARGGLSEAWGASILPYRDVDMATWPISARDLEPHYRAVLEFMPLAGEVDELAVEFPLFTDRPEHLPRTAQIDRILAGWRTHATDLSAAGYSFGASRLAVHGDGSGAAHCRACGLCMYGCPYDAIYAASHTLSSLVAAGRLEYRSGLHADALTESDGSVSVACHEVGRPGSRVTIEAERVFVACGHVGSTRLVARSLLRRPYTVAVADSLYFLTPVMMLRGGPASAATQGNTLAQAYLELDLPGELASRAHLQIYGYSDIMLRAAWGWLAGHQARADRILQPVVGRLLAIQGFLHSDDSPGLTMTVDDGGATFVGHDRAQGRATVRKILRQLTRTARATGFLPIAPMTQIGLPGKSFHSGGELPMRHHPGPMETDLLGRPAGTTRVHVVDSAVMPTIAGSTITFTEMANAHRIATASLAL